MEEVLKRLGPFNYNKYSLTLNANYPFLGPYQ